MKPRSELDQLLRKRFDISPEDFVAILRTLPAVHPWAATLTEDEARLLDGADFREDPDAYIAAATVTAGHAGHLAVSAFTPGEVQEGLGLSASRIRQKRLARELWAIPDGERWLFPAPQFVVDPLTRKPLRQVPGLAQVFKALPADMHPVAVAGFLHTPQAELDHDGPQTPLDWLRNGGDVALVVTAAQAADWYGR